MFFVGVDLVVWVNLYILVLFECNNYDVSVFKLKSWDVFVMKDVFKMDFVIIVCDKVVGEFCLIWSG